MERECCLKWPPALSSSESSEPESELDPEPPGSPELGSVVGRITGPGPVIMGPPGKYGTNGFIKTVS